MKTKRIQAGFTLIELLVSMSITVILLGILVYMTGISMDRYKESRNEVRASRQAKEAMNVIASDLESMVSRRDGMSHEWLYIGQEPRGLEGPNGKEVTNASQLIFFTGATDRYNGAIGTDQDSGGDVSAVCYRLVYRDQISNKEADEADSYPVFALYRHLVDPDETFGIGGAKGLLAVDNLQSEYRGMFRDQDDLTAAHFLVENIYEFTVTFLVEYTVSSGTNTEKRIERVTLRQGETSGYTEFRLTGDLISVKGGSNGSKFENGNIVGAEISITVLTDQGMVLAAKSGMKREEIIKKHTYHYTKKINTPRP